MHWLVSLEAGHLANLTLKTWTDRVWILYFDLKLHRTLLCILSVWLILQTNMIEREGQGESTHHRGCRGPDRTWEYTQSRNWSGRIQTFWSSHGSSRWNRCTHKAPLRQLRRMMSTASDSSRHSAESMSPQLSHKSWQLIRSGTPAAWSHTHSTPGHKHEKVKLWNKIHNLLMRIFNF